MLRNWRTPGAVPLIRPVQVPVFVVMISGLRDCAKAAGVSQRKREARVFGLIVVVREVYLGLAIQIDRKEVSPL